MATRDELRREVALLRRRLYESPPEAGSTLLTVLAQKESALADEEREAHVARAVAFSTEAASDHLGADTTGLEVECTLRMAQVPTAIAHLLDASLHPLLTCVVRNTSNEKRRVRVTSFVEGYSAHAIDSFEIKTGAAYTFNQLPTFFPDRIRTINELTRATLHIQVDDLAGQVEVHRTRPLWLLPQTTAPLAIKDPASGAWNDLTPYLGAFVTPNAPELQDLLHKAVELVPGKEFVSYQAGPTGVEPQVRALYEALQQVGLRYVNSVLAFSPDEGLSSQRVRLPRQTLASMNANCLDGTVLFASLLEAVSLQPGIVLIPGHAFVAWQADPNDPATWRYLETTVISTKPFEEARKIGDERAAAFEAVMTPETPHLFRRWALQDLRATRDVLPME